MHAPVAHGDLIHVREHGIDGIGIGGRILGVAAAINHACAKVGSARGQVSRQTPPALHTLEGSSRRGDIESRQGQGLRLRGCHCHLTCLSLRGGLMPLLLPLAVLL